MGQDAILRADGIGPPCVGARAKDRLTIGPQDSILPHKPRYSCRSDCTGSTFKARRAGPSAATRATNAIDSTAAAMTAGSRELA